MAATGNTRRRHFSQLANQLCTKESTRAPTAHVAPDFANIHEQLKEKGVTRLLLWEEYRAAHPDDSYGYSQFCFHYQQWQSHLKLVMRQTHRTGEKLFVDYAGPTVPIVNPITGEIREAQIFVAVLGASNYSYAEPFLSSDVGPLWHGGAARPALQAARQGLRFILHPVSLLQRRKLAVGLFDLRYL